MPPEASGIQPQLITRPIQLMAAYFLALIAVNSSFLGAAGLIKSPDWAPGVLVCAAVLNTPLFLACVFLLQTKYRREMMEDVLYYHLVKATREQTLQVSSEMKQVGLDSAALAQGRTLQEVPTDAREQLETRIRALEGTIATFKELTPGSQLPPETLLAQAHGLLAQEKWREAALVLEEYAKVRPQDWEAHYLRGVAFANTRGGPNTDLAALQAYGDAIDHTPSSLEPNRRARLYIYHGAMNRRLERLNEAESDFTLAAQYVRDEYERLDLLYNLACVYSLRGDRMKLMETLRQLQGAPQQLASIRDYKDRYFKAFADDPEFLEAIDGRMAVEGRL